MKYKKKPAIVEAIQWTGHNISDMCKFTHKDVSHLLVSGELYIETLERYLHISVGDYIIKGVQGEFILARQEFLETYETVEE